MSIDVKSIAKKATTLSELMSGREKIETRDIAQYFPNGIRIIAAEEVTMTDDTKEDGKSRFYIYVFKEASDKYAYSGTILTNIFDEIMAACAGDINEFNEALASGDLFVKLERKKTKDGRRDITGVTVL